MSANQRTDSKAIFLQMRALPPGSAGVRSIIENHDAWLNGAATWFHIDAAAKAELQCRATTGPQAPRIQAQRRALQSLVTPLPMRLSTAG